MEDLPIHATRGVRGRSPIEAAHLMERRQRRGDRQFAETLDRQHGNQSDDGTEQEREPESRAPRTATPAAAPSPAPTPTPTPTPTPAPTPAPTRRRLQEQPPVVRRDPSAGEHHLDVMA